ncbi:Dph6-related ATP pyrophosphatase [Pedobacter arcticus]|uniref:Dph6-related ATP pyrophosphatase n=1 Tax=Pedobacter arcticus TaxID=752140 RepID=UPI0003747D58|nr:diphthine--ammonia ligase [Pedobacter arcticus]
MNKLKCVFNWSGGKGSALALYHCLQDPNLDIRYLVTTINDSVNRISMHGVSYELLKQQAEEIGIELYEIRLPGMPDMQTYDETMRVHLRKFKFEGIIHSIFGDILLEDLRKYREDKLAEVGLTALFPLWKRDTRAVVDEFLAFGFKTVIVCTQEKYGNLLGEEINQELIRTFSEDMDVCGENGEFHTFAFDGPIFSKPIKYTLGEKVFKAFKAPKNSTDTCGDIAITQSENSGFWYVDLLAN